MYKQINGAPMRRNKAKFLAFVIFASMGVAWGFQIVRPGSNIKKVPQPKGEKSDILRTP